MKNIPLTLLEHIQGPVTTLATLWRIEREDGQVYGFTDSDLTLVYDDVEFKAGTGFTPSAIVTRENFSVDNLDVQTVLDDDVINEGDLKAGLWDGARVDIWVVNRRDLGAGHAVLRTGYLGEVKTGRQTFFAELRGLNQLAQTTKGRIYQASCDADLGDAQCGVNLDLLKVTGSVTTRFVDGFIDTTRTEAMDYFTFGKVKFTSGLNINRVFEVSSYDSATKRFKFFTPVPNAIAVTDTYEAFPGCDKSLATCKAKFSNRKNFRGFPFIPGQDAIIAPEIDKGE